MNPNYSKFLPIDLAFYEIHDDGYDSLKIINAFWNKYPIHTICDSLIALQPDLTLRSHRAEQKLNDEQLFTFSTDLFRALVAYLIAHYKEINLSKILPSAILAGIKEEVDTSKKIYDLFQRNSQIDTNT